MTYVEVPPMTEDQIRVFPALRTLPVYDEKDERSQPVAAGSATAAGVRKCATMREVEKCLAVPGLVPLGGVRVGGDGRKVVVVYFGRRT
jgi:hypothetical protein